MRLEGVVVGTRTVRQVAKEYNRLKRVVVIVVHLFEILYNSQ